MQRAKRRPWCPDAALRFAAVALLALSCAGCGDSPGALSVDGTRIHPPLLLSEIRAAKNPQELLHTEFRFVNDTDHNAVLRFDGSGCTCYDVTGPKGRLTRGESVTILAGETWPVSIGVSVPTSAGEREFNSRFVWVRSSEPEVPMPLSLTLPAYADVSVLPDVLTIGYRPGEPTPAQRLEVVRTARRREQAAVPPRTITTPESVTLGDWRECAVRQLPCGLWQSRWEATATVTMPDDCRDELTGAITVRVGDDLPAATISVFVQPRVGIRSPGRIQLGLLSLVTPRRRRVLLTAADGLPFRIVSLTPGDPRLTVEQLTPGAAARHWLMLEAVLSDAVPLDAELICCTDHPDSPTVALQVAGRAVADSAAATHLGEAADSQETP